MFDLKSNLMGTLNGGVKTIVQPTAMFANINNASLSQLTYKWSILTDSY